MNDHDKINAINDLRGHVSALHVLFQALAFTHPDRETLLTTLRDLARVAPAALERASPQQTVMTNAFGQALQAMLASVESRTELAARQETESQSAATRIVQSLLDQTKRPSSDG